MRIAFIGQKGIPTKTGGVERQIEDLAVSLAQAGHEVFVYARSSYNTEKLREYHGVKVITIPSINSKNLDAITATAGACFHSLFHKYDIIHFQSIGPASLIWLAKLFNPRTPLVFTFHCQDYYHQKWGGLARWFLKFGETIGNRLADKVIVTSHSLWCYTADKYHNDPVYIPSAAMIKEPLPAQKITARWGLTKDGYIAYIGRLVRHKGVHYLIAAYSKIKTDKKLVIVGDGAFTDDYVKELHQLAAGNPNIIFTGNQEGSVLQELFSNAAIFVQPSESEGLSFSLLEGMSYARPCLVSDIEPNLEAIGDTGVSFKNGSAEDLQAKLIGLLARPDSWPSLKDTPVSPIASRLGSISDTRHGRA
jgi:glycosyltransferase involved in cell wall biosynthesis